MIRTIIWFIYFWLYQLFSLPALVRVHFLHRRGKVVERDELVYRTAFNWGRSLVNLTGTEVRVTGAENVPRKGAVLFVANHQGRFDIPIVLGFIDKPKGFIAKIEMAKMPLVSNWMAYMHCVFMDRQDIRQSLKSINQGAEFLKAGYSQVIFPEGTRSMDGSLGEFKPGSFKLATKSGVPVVPVTIKGSNQIMKNNSFLITPAVLDLIISPPVPVDKNTDVHVLAEQVKGIIAEQL